MGFLEGFKDAGNLIYSELYIESSVLFLELEVFGEEGIVISLNGSVFLGSKGLGFVNIGEDIFY